MVEEDQKAATPAPLPVERKEEKPPVSLSDPSGSESSREEAGVLNGGGSSNDKKRKKSEESGGGDGCKSCSCKKSQCLKLYCVCFAAGTHCSETCSCEPCFNKPTNVSQRNLPAFSLKVIQASNGNQETKELVQKSPSENNKKGCTCKKSGCLKKYCDCYQGNGGCSINCKCEDCRNPFGRKVGIFLDGKSNLVPNGRNDAELCCSNNDEGDFYISRPLSPLPISPISRESSFQQDSLVGGVEVQTMNGHLYPKPLSQVWPAPWLMRRPSEEVRPEPSLTRRPSEEVRPEPWLMKKSSEEVHRERWCCSKRLSEDRTASITEGYRDCRFQRDNVPSSNREDQFSISRCIDVMNGMTELSQHEKSIAPDVFLEQNLREIFLSLSSDVRSMWLRRKIKHLM